jgi:hypothetical protein
MDAWQNVVMVETPRFTLSVALNAGDGAPGFARDHAALLTFCDVHAEILSRMAFDDVCDLIAREFPRASSIEVLDNDTRCGVMLHTEDA